MLTLQECLEFCELTEDEILAIAEHEHVPEIVAAELGDCLLRSEDGVCLIRRYMLDDIHNAELHGRHQRALFLHQVLDRFNQVHPETAASP
ncbi:MAG: hypothetical protein R3310_06100 [Candidatus Competibacteraceae bacterium]|nr:hypothetical protein [Candidatus Competibacteraceae bacterium]